MGGDRDGPRLAVRRGSCRRQGNEKYIAEEPERRPRLHQSSGVEQHSAARERAVGAAQAQAVLARVGGCIYLRYFGGAGLGLLLFCGPEVRRKPDESRTRCIAPRRAERI